MMGFILRLLEGLGGGTGCPGEAPGRSLLLEVREAIRKAGGIENLLPSTVSNYMLSEYAETGDVTRNRAAFRDGDMDYALFTERFHYYHRYHIKGIKHIIFYQLPTIAGLYAELLNMMPALGGTATILISRYDVLALQRVVGDSRGTKMLRAEKDTHLLC